MGKVATCGCGAGKEGFPEEVLFGQSLAPTARNDFLIPEVILPPPPGRRPPHLCCSPTPRVLDDLRFSMLVCLSTSHPQLAQEPLQGKTGSWDQGKVSATVRASQGPVYKGVCKCFCRSKGHGFITPADGGPDIFLHISDVEGEYVPVEGDEVTYKMCSIPPKHEKLQAVEVVITHLAPGTKHETWSGHVISS
nr:calcium-regulated heat stable protein 1 [Desmodus rotundus]